MRSLLPWALLLLVAAPAALAQTSTTSGSYSMASSVSVSTTLTNSVVSTAGPVSSSTSTSSSPAPTANVTNGVDQTLTLWAPEAGLVQCELATFGFTGPAVPKTCGVYVTNTSTYLEQIILGGAFTSLTAGTFSWLVDVPAGLSLEVQIFITLNGAVQQYTLHDQVVKAGANNSCLATGAGQNTQSIISYASSLNASYSRSPSESATSSGSGGASGGTIAGAVIGSLAGVAALVLLAFILYRRRRLTPPPPVVDDSKSTYSTNLQTWPPGSVPPPHDGTTYAQRYAANYYGNAPGGVVPYQAASPRGTIAEPMAAITPPGTPGSPLETMGEFGGRQGTQGLDDPATFVDRSTASGSGGRGK
ncbi:hypothetical protein JCM5296_002634 [Sporobolomyces johnsonii]